jgi:hypothetical protein
LLPLILPPCSCILILFRSPITPMHHLMIMGRGFL